MAFVCRWRYQGTTLGKAVWDRQAPASQATYLDPLALLVHGLHVIVELGDISEASKILLLLGQEVLGELVQVPVLRQLQQPQMCHLVALETLALPLLGMLLGFDSCSLMRGEETDRPQKVRKEPRAPCRLYCLGEKVRVCWDRGSI